MKVAGRLMDMKRQLAAKDAEIATLRAQLEEADALTDAVALIPGFMSVVSSVVQDVWKRYGVKDTGLPFNPDEVAGNVEDAAKAYKESRRGGCPLPGGGE